MHAPPLPRWLLAVTGMMVSATAFADTASPVLAVIAAETHTAEIADRIQALGTLHARESVDLTANVTETISAMSFDDGERVKRGQVLVEMTRAEEHADLEEARSTLAEAESQFQRAKRLAADGSVSQSDLDQRRRDQETARARLAAIESRLADRLIRAPFDGTLGLRKLSVGALVQPGDVVATLDDDSVMKLDFPVASTYLPRLQPGLKIEATTRAYPNATFTGDLKSIDSRVDAVTRSVQARALIPNPDGRLKPGMLMQVNLLSRPRQALLIPEEALVPLGSQQFVLVVGSGNVVERREVQIGTRTFGNVEIVDGLKAGERVITHGTTKARPGQTVRVEMVDDGERGLPGMLKDLRKDAAPSAP